MQTSPQDKAPPSHASFRVTLVRVLVVQATAIGLLAAIQAMYSVP
jgi:hypothetical protein